MTQWHTRAGTKPSGGIRNARNRCIKRLAWKGSDPTLTTIATGQAVQTCEGIGKTRKAKLKRAAFANVALKGGKTTKAKILAVTENSADRQFARRNIITKGAKITIELDGAKRAARVTSRPGQNGSVSALLLEGVVEEKAKKKAIPKKNEPKEAEKPEAAEKTSKNKE